MAFTSFRIRRADLVEAPDLNPFGSYVRGSDTEAPPGQTRLVSDSALRADGFIIATDKFISVTFTAKAISYSSVLLEWTPFTLNNPVLNTTGDTTITDVVIVYSKTGPPETVRNGTVVKTQLWSDPLYSATHINAPEGRWAYYSMFLHYNQNGTGASGVNWYEKVAELQELVPKDLGSVAQLWGRIPQYYRVADTIGRNLDPEIKNRGQLERFINIFGFELDRTRTLIDSVMSQYDPNITDASSIENLSEMFGLEMTPPEIGISKSRQILQDIGYYRQRKGTLASVQQYLSAVTNTQVDILESPVSPRYSFRVYAERVNLVVDSKFVITSGTKKWKVEQQDVDTTVVNAAGVLTISNPTAAAVQVALVSDIAVPVLADIEYWSSVKMTGDGSVYGGQWAASGDWSDWATDPQDELLLTAEIAPTDRVVIKMPDLATTGSKFPVTIFSIAAESSITLTEWMVEPYTSGTFWNGDSDFGGFIYQNFFADYAWSGSPYASYSLYSTSKKRTQDAVTTLLPRILPVSMLIDTTIFDISTDLTFDWIPGRLS